MTDLISRDMAVRALVSSNGDYLNALERLEKIPAVDAVPVEWLEAQIRPYTGDVSDIGKSARNGTIKNLIRKWQKEQEAQDG